MKKVFVLIAVLITGSLLAGPSAAGAAQSSAEATPTPLNVRIVSPDGKAKLKATRKLTAVMSCNRDCRISVRFTLRMPAGTLRNGGAMNLFDGAFWSPSMLLNATASRYLRSNYRASTFKVVVSAKDLETGATASKTRVFRFYK